MRSELVLRTPSHGTGWEESWAFSGRDERLLRESLAQLDQYSTPAPLERWDNSKRVIDPDDRWLAAMLLYPEDVRGANDRFANPQYRAEHAWTAAGARRLAELLPDDLVELRTSIERRFG
jgi:hypothetical protein